MDLYGIFGAGGFGREVIPIAYAMLKEKYAPDQFKLVFIDDNKISDFANHYAVMNVTEFFSVPAENKFFNIAIANGSIRKKIAELMIAKGAKSFRINALNFIELDNNVIDEGSIFCPYAMVTSNAKIGKFFHANFYSYVAHDCIIGDYVTFAPDAHCNGNIIIEDNVYVGTGVVIKQGKPDCPLVIGEGAVLGMGAVVTKSVSAFETVVGNPARPLIKEKV